MIEFFMVGQGKIHPVKNLLPPKTIGGDYD
jgi:hypothetical protein